MDTNQNKTGSSIAIVIVIIIIAFAGIYVWYSKSKVQTPVRVDTNASEEVLRNDLQASGEVNIDEDLKGIDSIYDGK